MVDGVLDFESTEEDLISGEKDKVSLIRNVYLEKQYYQMRKLFLNEKGYDIIKDDLNYSKTTNGIVWTRKTMVRFLKVLDKLILGSLPLKEYRETFQCGVAAMRKIQKDKGFKACMDIIFQLCGDDTTEKNKSLDLLTSNLDRKLTGQAKERFCQTILYQAHHFCPFAYVTLHNETYYEDDDVDNADFEKVTGNLLKIIRKDCKEETMVSKQKKAKTN